jgi:hypothetical protein
MRPGATNAPVASTVATPAGTGHSARVPAQAMRPPRVTTTASGTRGAPGFTSVAPTMASGGGLAPAGSPNAVLTAIFHPSAVRTNTRSEIPSVGVPPDVTR